jgi:hypothetical protein
MGGRSTSWSLDLGMMTTIGFQSPLEKTLNCQNPLNIVPTRHSKSLLSILTGNKVLAYQVTTWMKNKVSVCYLNPDKILIGLSISTQKNLTILLYGVTKE